MEQLPFLLYVHRAGQGVGDGGREEALAGTDLIDEQV